MEKKIVKTISVFTVFILLCLISSCASLLSPRENSVIVEPKDFGEPENSTVVFGYISQGKRPGQLFGQELPMELDTVEFVQINPDKEPLFVLPGKMFTDGTMFYTHPVKPGMILKMIQWKRYDDVNVHYSYGRQMVDKIYTVIPQVFGEEVTVEIKKPGLYYFGNYAMDYEKNIFVKNDNPEKTELNILKKIIDDFKNTAWENVINERIKELEG
jgi:hypothetical protein